MSLVPTPRLPVQYPLYSASIQLYGGTLLPYNLKEQTGWSMDFNEITRSVHEARCVPPDGGGCTGVDTRGCWWDSRLRAGCGRHPAASCWGRLQQLAAGSCRQSAPAHVIAPSSLCLVLQQPRRLRARHGVHQPR